ncbi:hypothetical protein [Corynebacterium jeddahense]|uniref:DNA-binding protein n=1 Tax=Corynebacterium jeddahense TaxID=1414719 RepID=A0ABY7UHB6_9CORY|nr:hypothetical protein [Corynebacterium jeddahense]WCZ37827.1 hypothetical protein CJEDD_01000 [Corynebacterium jeddahense]
MTKFEQWLSSFRGHDSDRQIALNSGLPPTTLARQLREETVTVETAVKIARAYQVSAVPGLLALDILIEQDLEGYAAQMKMELLSDEQLAAEVLKRMKRGSEVWNRPISHVEDDLKQIRDQREAQDLGAFAADSSPDEPEEGDEGFGEGP